MTPRVLVAVLTPLIATCIRADDAVIATMDEMVFRPPPAKGKAELVEGKVGKAIRFRFDADARSLFFTSNLRGNPAWDLAAGFSFWVRGRI